MMGPTVPSGASLSEAASILSAMADPGAAAERLAALKAAVAEFHREREASMSREQALVARETGLHQREINVSNRENAATARETALAEREREITATRESLQRSQT